MAPKEYYKDLGLTIERIASIVVEKIERQFILVVDIYLFLSISKLSPNPVA
jgi:hypothetical protein